MRALLFGVRRLVPLGERRSLVLPSSPALLPAREKGEEKPGPPLPCRVSDEVGSQGGGLWQGGGRGPNPADPGSPLQARPWQWREPLQRRPWQRPTAAGFSLPHQPILTAGELYVMIQKPSDTVAEFKIGWSSSLCVYLKADSEVSC